MAMINPVSRANYEPNSWPGGEGGPREDPAAGFESFPSPESGEQRRLRPESFADHYSQARQFYVSQTDVERRHIAEAFTFELSKCDRGDIRTRMVAGLRNVDEDLAATVAEGLGLRELPEAVTPAREPRRDLPPSAALSILRRGPDSFAGRVIGVLITNGADAGQIANLRAAAAHEDATVELVTPAAGGVDASDGTLLPGQQVDGAPSVRYDAVAVIAGEGGARSLAGNPAARDFLTDAYAHCKFIARTSGAAPLFEAAGVGAGGAMPADDGIVSLEEHSAADFVARCRQLRFWDREHAMVA
jgi:catalase